VNFEPGADFFTWSSQEIGEPPGGIDMIKKISPRLTDEGVGAKAYRLIPNDGEHLDPFVLFDEYYVDPDASFPMHPHGGFEGFQFLMNGTTEYKDVFGNIGSIEAGDVRRFVAGQGFKHSEYPMSNETVRGYLLWIKLPDTKKNISTYFQELHGGEVYRQEDDISIETRIFGEGGRMDTHTPAVFKHYIFKKDARLKFELACGWNGFVYISSGSATICGVKIGDKEGIIIDPCETCDMEIEQDTELVLVKGRILNEDIVQKGHFVR
jgi:redox-sensitive bicupin YhaK (pirin superfamily)